MIALPHQLHTGDWVLGLVYRAFPLAHLVDIDPPSLMKDGLDMGPSKPPLSSVRMLRRLDFAIVTASTPDGERGYKVLAHSYVASSRVIRRDTGMISQSSAERPATGSL